MTAVSNPGSRMYWAHWVVPVEYRRQEQSWEGTECCSSSGMKGKQTWGDSKHGSMGKQGRVESWCGQGETSCQGMPVVCGNSVNKTDFSFPPGILYISQEMVTDPIT